MSTTVRSTGAPARLPYACMTYVPGAFTPAGCRLLPSFAGAGFRSPEWSASHVRQSTHHVSFSARALASHASALVVKSELRKNFAFGLPGGLIRLWIWPLELSTKRVSPERARRVVHALPRRDVIGRSEERRVGK